MTPGKLPTTQEQADALAAKLQDFWRQSALDFQSLIGQEAIARENEIIALNSEKARNSIDAVAKKLKEASKDKRGKNGSD